MPKLDRYRNGWFNSLTHNGIAMSYIRKPWSVTPVALITLGFAVSMAHAGNMYVFKDKTGNVLLTNVVSNNKKPRGNRFHTYTDTVKVTYYKDTNVHEYKDWGKTEAAVPSSFSSKKTAYDHLISSAAARHGVEPGLIKAMMHTESGFNPKAVSPAGAQGLMQLMPATAARFSVKNVWDPAQNIEGSAKYLAFLLKRFNNNVEHALAGYNAGEGNVDKYRGIPPFKETRNYVKKVLSRYHSLYKVPMHNATTSLRSGSSTHYSKDQLNQNRLVRSRDNTAAAYEASAFAALKR